MYTAESSASLSHVVLPLMEIFQDKKEENEGSQKEDRSSDEQMQEESAGELSDSNDCESHEPAISPSPQETALVTTNNLYSKDEQRHLARQDNICEQYNIIAEDNAFAISSPNDTLADDITNKWIQFAEMTNPDKLVDEIGAAQAFVHEFGHVPAVSEVKLTSMTESRMRTLPAAQIAQFNKAVALQKIHWLRELEKKVATAHVVAVCEGVIEIITGMDGDSAATMRWTEVLEKAKA